MGAARALLQTGRIITDAEATEHIQTIKAGQIKSRAEALLSPATLIFHP